EFLSRPRSRATTGLRHGVLIPVLGLAATIVVGVSGSLAALGDTLYPATSLANAMHQDFSATSSLLLRLRWMHPASAFVAGAFIVWLVVQALRKEASPLSKKLAIALLVLLVVQYALGAMDVLLLAPLWMQVVHLLFADMLWICLVLLTAHFCLTRRRVSAYAKTSQVPPLRVG
ncbi:MAG TPA: COX15/CtaA family protein, partial [Acidobacteriaceae bacterium]|nr:COX15/CtaA family protein [Acidobacteriaceae bacterium]